MSLIPYLEEMVRQNASDAFFSAGAPVSLKVEGEIAPLDSKKLGAGDVLALISPHLSAEQLTQFEQTLELNLSLAIEDLARFRVNLYRQRGEVSMVVRYVPTRVPDIDELRLPPTLRDIIMEPRGLVLVVGSTGSGKSTALASMIKHRSEARTGHILTIEEPIEFVHQHASSLVEQREVGVDTLSYAAALKNAMREAPDVIMIGEIRDRETMQSAIAYAETGHLCLSTLHANNASHALERIVNFFPESSHQQLLLDVSINLVAIISLRLLRGVDGKRLPAFEILLRSPYIAELIQERDISGLKDAMTRGMVDGMVTFDQTIYRLWQEGRISAEVALANADSKSNMHRLIKLSHGAVEQDSGLSMDGE
jgi:twitching motility protein PilU